MIRRSAWLVGKALPLSTRQTLVTAAGRRKLPAGTEFAMGLLDDLRHRDPVGFHRFLWSNHLAYAERYEVSRKFGSSSINPTRHILFSSIAAHLRSRGLDPGTNIQSVFEIGCSMGYLLRHLEEQIFPSATILHGLDIDTYAVNAGAAHLSSLGSRVKLFAADMEDADRVMSNHQYDLVLCCGVLMYVNESIAEKVVQAMFARAGRLVGLICLAAPRNAAPGNAGSGSAPGRSEVRESDGAFIHDIDLMIRRAGGSIVSSELIGCSTSGSSPSHVILAEPATQLPLAEPNSLDGLTRLATEEDQPVLVKGPASAMPLPR